MSISDISCTKVKSIIGAFIHGLKEKEIMSIRLPEIILRTKNIERLTGINVLLQKFLK